MKDDFYIRLKEIIKDMSSEELDKLIDFAHVLIAQRNL